MPHYKLTYLDLNARGEPIRMMFALAGVEYEDVRVNILNWKNYIKQLPVPELDGVEIVRALAKEFKTPFQTFPMLEVNDVKIGQTLAAVRYLGKEFGFAGPDNLTSALADALCDQMADYVMSWMGWHMANKGFSKRGNVKELYEKEFMPSRAKNLPFFEEALKKSSTGWIVNTPDVTHADVFVATSIEMILRLVPDPSTYLEGFPLLQAHQKKFFAHPKLQKHLQERPQVEW